MQQTFKIYSWERESGIDEPQGIKRNYLFVFLHLEWCAAIERDRISDHEGRYEARDLEIKEWQIIKGKRDQYERDR